MNHDLKISISRESPGGGIVRCRTVTLRERFLNRLMGVRHRVTVLIPGESIRNVSITQMQERSEEDEGT